MRHYSRRIGFTLVEMLVVVAVLLILAALLFPNAESLLNRAESVICTGKLRTLWTAFSSSLTDGQGWPQLPSGMQIGSPAEQQWWIETTSNSMGLSQKSWQCPTITRLTKTTNQSSQSMTTISYLPTLFDSRPTTPLKQAKMPWFTEICNVHGQGNLIIRTDGAVVPSDALHP